MDEDGFPKSIAMMEGKGLLSPLCTAQLSRRLPFRFDCIIEFSIEFPSMKAMFSGLFPVALRGRFDQRGLDVSGCS
jgi:hypothetical protein